MTLCKPLAVGKIPEIVKAYIHVFQLQRFEGWPEITELIEATPELQFGEPAPAPTLEVNEEPAATEAPAEEEEAAPAEAEAADPEPEKSGAEEE